MQRCCWGKVVVITLPKGNYVHEMFFMNFVDKEGNPIKQI